MSTETQTPPEPVVDTPVAEAPAIETTVTETKKEIKDPEAVLRSLDAAREDAKKYKQQANALSAQLQETQSQQKSIQEQLQQFQSIASKFEGMDPDQIKAWKQTHEQAEQAKRESEEAKLASQGELETIRKRYQDELAAARTEFEKVRSGLQEKLTVREQELLNQVNELKTKTEHLDQSLNTTRIESEFAKSYGAVRGKTEYYNMLLQEASRVLGKADDGSLTVLTNDRATQRLNADGDPMTLDQYMTELQGKYPDMFFKSVDKSGGGKSPTTTASAPAKPREIDASDLNNLAKLGLTLEDIKTGKVTIRG